VSGGKNNQKNRLWAWGSGGGGTQILKGGSRIRKGEEEDRREHPKRGGCAAQFISEGTCSNIAGGSYCGVRRKRNTKSKTGASGTGGREEG